ncbi:toll-like receptor 5 [Diadema setosum]|uniref:toll-like receptor 5 n=1 Tax=Diadema setosum TaxID=31175 RepID=UPI003B3B4381
MAGSTVVQILNALMALSYCVGHWEQAPSLSPLTCSTSGLDGSLQAHCSHLNLSTVPQNLPDNLSKLDLSYNNIATITNVSFASYGKIEILLLQWNTVNQIEGKSFESLQALQVLDLSGNNISRLPDALFHNNIHLTILDLSNNRLTEIPNNALGSIRALKNIFLSHNVITNISFSQFSSCEHLSEIDITSNEITHLWQDSFANLRDCSINNLILAYNNLSQLPQELFSHFRHLQYLNLNNTNLLTFDMRTFMGNYTIKQMWINNELLLQDNVLTLFDKNLFTDTPNLTHLYLHTNHLTMISADTYMAPTLVRLDISHNPFTCDCSLAWFRNWLYTTNVDTSPSNETLCAQTSFKQLVNLPLQAFDPDDFCGIDAPLISGLIFGGAILSLLGVLIYRKRWWLNYKIFLLKLCVLGYKQQEEDLEADDYEYQLNIMCHDNDDDWVHGVLRPELEERMPHLQRVAYGDEAFRATMYYIDAVHHVIENSYKTVLLISNHCADDAWFITKVRVALEHVNETGLDKVILVFLEDISDERLPYLVRLFLSRDRPNLLWTEDQDGQNLFWAYLEKCMRTNPQINHALPI